MPVKAVMVNSGSAGPWVQTLVGAIAHSGRFSLLTLPHLSA